MCFLFPHKLRPPSLPIPYYPLYTCRSVHAHIILWIHDDDANQAISKIRSCMPAGWDPEGVGPINRETGLPTKGCWIEPPETDPLRRSLFRSVRRKQQHICTAVKAPGCRSQGHICAGHFPQPVHTSKEPTEDPTERCYRYYCPGEEHRNIGPYIPVSDELITM